MIIPALEKILAPKKIVERNDIGSRKFEGLEANVEFAGESQETVSVDLNGLKFEADLRAGHKTGLYLDQQLNYQYVSGLAAGAHVLDCFSFIGGFGLHAARAGAAHVRLID